jgi:hypothetical protein
MKEMHLTPDLWVVSAKAIFLPKIAIWNEEIHFWKVESTQLKRLIILGAIRSKQEDKNQLMLLEKQLTEFLQVQLPPLEQEIQPLERILEGKALGCKFRKVEARIEQLRKTYYDLKMQLLPFLAKFISVQIW